MTQKLLYEDMNYDYAIKNGIAVVAESDVFLYKNKTSLQMSNYRVK